MSQVNNLGNSGGALAVVETLTGNTGGAVGPDGAHNINVVGTAGQVTVTGNPGTNTLTISLSGGGAAIDSIGTQTGTNPIEPTGAGLVTINGAVVAAGTNPVRSDGTGANTMAIEVQISQAIASTDATKIGLCNFDSGSFSVDANGFVALKGGTEAIDSIGVDAATGPGTNPVLPTAGGLVTVNGAVVAAGTNPIRTNSLAANVYQIQAQISQAIASTDATKIGLSNFSSAHFAVDSNGFVTLVGGGQAVDSFIPNSGTSPVVPAADGSITLQGTGSITVVGGTNSLTPQLTGLTNHAIQVGAGTATLTQVGPTATAGQVLQSAGSSADPAFSTATYPSTTTVNQILYSSATNTVSGISASIDGVLISNHATGVPSWLANGTAGYVLTAQSGAPPAWAPDTTGIIPWTAESSSFNALANHGYFITGDSVVATLSGPYNEGDIVDFIITNEASIVANIFTIFHSNYISISGVTGNNNATVTTETSSGATISLVFRNAISPTWYASSVTGVWTLN